MYYTLDLYIFKLKITFFHVHNKQKEGQVLTNKLTTNLG